MILERDLRVEVQRRWIGWMETYEPAAGGGIGIPDFQLLVRGVLKPIELKRGEIVDGLIFPDAVRPAQVSWHHRFSIAGGKSWFLIGCEAGKATAFFLATAMNTIEHRKTGLKLNKHCWYVPIADLQTGDPVFSSALEKFLR